jgi:hypothetical protein
MIRLMLLITAIVLLPLYLKAVSYCIMAGKLRAIHDQVTKIYPKVETKEVLNEEKSK